VDATVESKLVTSAYLATDERWPTWGPQASALGFNSVLSAELHSRGRRIGALNLYGAEEASFTREDIVLAELFARQGALALGYARSEEGLREALETRTVIGQAQGLLMERFQIDGDRAFATLRRYSQRNNIKLKVLCRRLVETRALPPEPGP
jgi:GAF domain-containing protein